MYAFLDDIMSREGRFLNFLIHISKTSGQASRRFSGAGLRIRSEVIDSNIDGLKLDTPARRYVFQLQYVNVC